MSSNTFSNDTLMAAIAAIGLTSLITFCIIQNKVEELSERIEKIEQLEESRAVRNVLSDIEQRAARVREMRRRWAAEDAAKVYTVKPIEPYVYTTDQHAVPTLQALPTLLPSPYGNY